MLLRGVPVGVAFLAGIASFLSPCVVPLLPAYLGMLAGEAGKGARNRLLFSGLLFAVGFSAVFVAMGATAGALGQWLLRWADALRIASGVVVILMGLFMMGLFNFNFLLRERRFSLPAAVGWARPLLLGIGFALGWTPCVGPALSSVLLLAANAGTALRGVGLLAVYSLGLALPFLAAAFLSNALVPRLKGLKRCLPVIQKIGGALLVLMGIAVLLGWMDKLAAISGALL